MIVGDVFWQVIRLVFMSLAIWIAWENLRKDKHGRALVCLLLMVASTISFFNTNNMTGLLSLVQRIFLYLALYGVLIGIHLNGSSLTIEVKAESVLKKIIKR